ncbi:NADH-quinone oxidoreductase subunit A [Frigoriflavimonas asaccharolytica]|uniref:NADH-quinone oxidoreductase subunit A n=1 Tax=Frigoriflavimonas asaccharolytica TaxID=2735899 RepID=A0A8J8K554_9FLAO|nr:NADH-quinone oxidoreductase subunit A [Frigoriflavimonas asaccharolytica]NRS92445.1 NADH-quinone oxidoreductase subunit A [Frigoriflavimonas asaccharolytica]
MSLPESYIPILLQASVGIGFVAISLIGAKYLGPQQKDTTLQKNSSFECGVEVEGNARTPFSIKYFLTAVLFVLFDIEIVFFYPYAINFREFGMEGFLAVVMFVAVFFMAFIYVWKRGALDWDK